MKKWPMLVGALALLIAVQPAEAQVAFGPQVAVTDDGDFGVGGRVEFDLTRPFGVTEGFFAGIFGMVSGTYFFPDCPSGLSCSLIDISGNVGVPIPIDAAMMPYIGAGIHWMRSEVSNGGSFSATQTGLNILGGIKFPLGGMSAFAEAKLATSTGSPLVIALGVLFGG